MVQAADRRQLGATSTPPSLPAPSWRRDLSEAPLSDIANDLAPVGAFCVAAAAKAAAAVRLRPPDRPAAVMMLAPVLGVAIWVGLVLLLT